MNRKRVLTCPKCGCFQGILSTFRFVGVSSEWPCVRCGATLRNRRSARWNSAITGVVVGVLCAAYTDLGGIQIGLIGVFSVFTVGRIVEAFDGLEVVADSR